MRLLDLLDDVDVLELRGDPGVEITGVVHDHREAGPGSCFVAVAGASVDGHGLVPAAVARGAAAVVVERPVDAGAAVVVRVPSTRAAAGPLAAALHGHPSRTVRCLGVTGTNGKTTVTHLLEAVAAAAGERPGVVGTLGSRGGGRSWPAEHTTPEATRLQARLAAMRDAGVTVVAMEVSSHALAQRRVDGTRFAAVCLTNLTQDHLDFHGDLAAYVAAKARLLTPAFAPAAAVGVAGPHGADLAAAARRSGLEVCTFGTAEDADLPDLAAEDVSLRADGTCFVLADRRHGWRVPVATRLVGAFNVENALAAASTALLAGIPRDAVVAGLGAPVTVPGRLEAVRAGQPFAVLVDYAHTPDALEKVVAAARGVAGDGRVLLAFGCGGDRDRAKRPLMGRAAGGADVVVVTSDNPRSEDPAAIAAQAAAGLRGTAADHVVELDRREAIRRVLSAARPGDVVVVAGKGHETGQTAGGVTVAFDDRAVARELLGELGWS